MNRVEIWSLHWPLHYRHNTQLTASSLNSSYIVWSCASGHYPVVGGYWLSLNAIHRVWPILHHPWQVVLSTPPAYLHLLCVSQKFQFVMQRSHLSARNTFFQSSSVQYRCLLPILIFSFYWPVSRMTFCLWYSAEEASILKSPLNYWR